MKNNMKCIMFIRYLRQLINCKKYLQLEINKNYTSNNCEVSYEPVIVTSRLSNEYIMPVLQYLKIY